jgi:hypothetical protein
MKCTFEDVYNYYKFKLLTDDDLMVNGSQTYINAYNNYQTIVPTGYPVEFNNISIQSNIDHLYIGAPFAVRESGIYMVFFISSNDQACQYTIFVNGLPNLLTTTGNNSGAGQLIQRNLLKLQKDDVISVRNYSSSSNALQNDLYAGGTQQGNNGGFLMQKISNYDCDSYKDELCKWSNECLSKRKQYLFKKLLEKMLLDKDLMLQGFNIHGVFYTTVSQTIGLEQNIMFDSYSNVNGIVWNSSNPDQLVVTEDGIYKIFFVLTTNTSAQFAFAVNGVPIDYTIQGTNKGAGQLSSRTLLNLKAGDIITITNHSSAVQTVTTSANAGGIYASMSSLLTIFKIAPSVPAVINPCSIKEYYMKCYEQFKCYLLSSGPQVLLIVYYFFKHR